MDYPSDRFYHSEHLWLKMEGNDVAIVGITWHAQDTLGSINYVDCAPASTSIQIGNTMGVIESAKTASDLIAPASGIIIEVNVRLSTEPELMNNDPYQEGWVARIKLGNKVEISQLLDAASYAKYVTALSV